MHILDSSAIAVILKRLGGEAVEIIRRKTTLNLAGYELGNIIWKECVLKGLITPAEAVSRAGETAKILGIMKIEAFKSSEDFIEIMKLSTKLKITFYDASYLHLAKKSGLTLITEDKELKEKAKQITIEAISIDELLNEE